MNGNVLRARLFGAAMMVLGVAGWWYNWHLATTEGSFSIKLCVFVPAAIFGGLLMMIRPDWAGPWRPDSTREHKIAMIAVIAVMAVGSGIEFFRLKSYVDHHAVRATTVPWSPAMGVPVIPASLTSRETPAITFLGKQYRLASYNQQSHPMWEFVTPGETIDDWKTLFTIIDRPDAHNRQDLDRLAEGILSLYRSRDAKIMGAKTIGDSPENTFNYVVAAFDEPSHNRYELNFVKMSMGPRNAVIAIYGVRIADPRDYRVKAKDFVNASAVNIGVALEKFAVPDLGTFPRKPF